MKVSVVQGNQDQESTLSSPLSSPISCSPRQVQKHNGDKAAAFSTPQPPSQPKLQQHQSLHTSFVTSSTEQQEETEAARLTQSCTLNGRFYVAPASTNTTLISPATAATAAHAAHTNDKSDDTREATATTTATESLQIPESSSPSSSSSHSNQPVPPRSTAMLSKSLNKKSYFRSAQDMTFSSIASAWLHSHPDILRQIPGKLTH